MKKINSLNDLLMEELSDLLNDEHQLIEALPKMAEASQSAALKSALDEYLQITREQINRLEDIFSNIGENPSRGTGNTIKGFIAESQDTVSRVGKSSTRDAAIISVAQRIEQFQIIEYKKAREHASDLGHTRMVEIFTKSLNEQRAINFHLNELAQYIINIQATDPQNSRESKEGGFYVPEGKFNRNTMKKTKPADVSRFINEGNPNTQEQSP